MLNRACAHINLGALRGNLSKVKQLAPHSKILAMIKCNAYGHCATQVAQSLEGRVDILGVIFIKEALELRQAGVQTPIVLLSGFFDAEELGLIDQYGFEVLIHNDEQLALLAQSHLSRKLKVWLKIDTGMHRLGFQPSQVAEIYHRLSGMPQVDSENLRFMTHFSHAGELMSAKTSQQLARFSEAVQDRRGEWCLANSAAILSVPESHRDWVRPGLLLYGVSPLASPLGVELGLRPVMTLTAPIIALHEIEPGESIGYSGTFVAPQRMKIGIMAIGYGDGYPRSVKNPPVLVNGVKTRLVGRVAMDMVAVDLSEVGEVKLGTEVVLWGEGLPIEEVAEHAGAIPYELFCRLTSRVLYKFYQK